MLLRRAAVRDTTRIERRIGVQKLARLYQWFLRVRITAALPLKSISRLSSK